MTGKRQGTGGSVNGPGGEWERFGRRVGELREEAGLSRSDLVTRDVCEAGTLQRVEEGSLIPPLYLAEYLDRRLSAQSRVVNAWARALLNTHLATGARPQELDSSASTLREFHPGTLPPALQTHDYTTALERTGVNPAKGTAWWNRMGSLRVVVNESAVRTRVGGAEVMRGQLDRIATSMRGSGLRLQIIPADVAEHPCPMGPFRLLSLGPVYTVGHLLSPCGDGHLVTDPAEVRALTDVFEDLRGAALPVTDSLDLLVHIAESLKPGPEQRAITRGNGSDPALTPLPAQRVAQHSG